MKKIILPIMVIMLNFAASFANTNSNYSVVEHQYDNIQINIDLGDITGMSDVELYNKIDASLMLQILEVASIDSVEELTCTMTVTGSVGVGSNKLEISITVSGPCSEVNAAAKKLLQEAKDAIKEAL